MEQQHWTVIADQSSLESASEQLAAGVGPFGVDTERASGFTYSNRAYLVQVYRRGSGTFLIDPTGVDSFTPLAQALAADEWILHSADQDLPSLSEIGLVPDRLFDTELGSRLLGYERVGLGFVTERLLGVALEKAHSAVDWSTRPLPQPWLEYAALDVALLPDLRDRVAEELVAAGKLDYAMQEFEAVRVKPPKAANAEPWRKLSGGHQLRTPRQLAIARELWKARDSIARRRDTAPGRLVPDKSLVAAAVANPRSKGDLAALKTFRGRASRTELDRWWRAIVIGKSTEDLPGPAPREPGSIPHHRGWAQRHPEAAERLSALRAVVSAEAERQHMPVENLITPSVIRAIAWEPPADTTEAGIALRLAELGARPWQIGLVAPIVSAVFVEPI